MTSTSEMEVTCPSCDQSFTITVYHSINAALEPDLRRRLLDLELNMGICEVCGEKAFMPVPILYHDPVRQFGVMFHPDNQDFLGPEEMSEVFTAEGKMAEEVPFYDPHIVLSIGEMLRYIQLRETLYERKNLWYGTC
jgi:hypothetical protein